MPECVDCAENPYAKGLCRSHYDKARPRRKDRTYSYRPAWAGQRDINAIPGEEAFDEAICWRGGSEAQQKRHIRRGEEPCRNCQNATSRAAEDRNKSRYVSSDKRR